MQQGALEGQVACIAAAPSFAPAAAAAAVN